MKLNPFILSVLVLSCITYLFSACKRYTAYEVSGIIINKVTGEAIEGAKVKLQDGIATSDPILPSEGPSTKDEIYTDSNGYYHLKIKTKGNHAVLQAGKKGYEFKVISEGGGSSSGWKFIPSGINVIDLELQGLAHFDGSFHKNSSEKLDSDTLLISLLSYENINDGLRSLSTKQHIGKGPFTFYNDDDDSGVNSLGDRYLRYKLEWTTQGIWHSKIDSVFLPTSQEVYRETIYY